jgi:hypothetical protein
VTVPSGKRYIYYNKHPNILGDYLYGQPHIVDFKGLCRVSRSFKLFQLGCVFLMKISDKGFIAYP